jgi:cyclic pyranopterin phosphate synthase
MSELRLLHTTPDGRARMVDVGEKPATDRAAVAEAVVRISPALEAAIRENSLKKGSLLEVARLAGIQAAKRTDELIPLCHSLPLDAVEVEATLEPGRVRLRAEARTHAKTGVEMEALTAAAVAALTVIDMGKAVDKGMVIEGLRLLEKRGGRSGEYRAPETAP